MRSTIFSVALLVACGGNAPDPRIIPGGGIGDGSIDGTLNVAVIDSTDDSPIANAQVAVGDVELTTNADGFAVFSDLSGPQTIAAKADGYRSTAWVGADGANVTLPLDPTGAVTTPQATLSGSIAGWDTVTVAQNHVKAAVVLYSQSDRLGDDANNLQTPNGGNVCGVTSPTTCDWTVVTRTGTVTLIAAIVDRDTKGTLTDPNDDTTEIIGWATKTGLEVSDGVGQTGLVLDLVEVGNLQNITVDLGTPPAGLPTVNAIAGIEISDDEVAQLPLFLGTDQTTLLAPKPSVLGGSTYRLSAIASGDVDGAQSVVVRRGLAGPDLAAGEWLVPPTSVSITRTDASWEPSPGAIVHGAAWEDAQGQSILEITTFDGSTSVTVPALVAVPTSGVLTGRVTAIGADIDVHDFSLEDDADNIFAIASEPTDVP